MPNELVVECASEFSFQRGLRDDVRLTEMSDGSYRTYRGEDNCGLRRKRHFRGYDQSSQDDLIPALAPIAPQKEGVGNRQFDDINEPAAEAFAGSARGKVVWVGGDPQ